MLLALAAFLGVSLVVICTPGPDTALTIRNSLTGGRRAGVATATGVSCGQLIWTLASAVGLAALLADLAAPARVAEAARGGLPDLPRPPLAVAAWRLASPVEGPVPVRQASGAAFRQGLVSNLANPKMVAFFLSLLPQFVPPGVHPVTAFVLLGLAVLPADLRLAVPVRLRARPGPRPVPASQRPPGHRGPDRGRAGRARRTPGGRARLSRSRSRSRRRGRGRLRSATGAENRRRWPAACRSAQPG